MHTPKRKYARNLGRLTAPLLVLIFISASAGPAYAIPAFARKYRTSCQTCHVAFPNLTPFGEAFRLNGYRFPEGSDISASKDDAVSLGAEGYKKLWPKAVWPGEMPGIPPISVVIESEIVRTGADNTTSFSNLGGEVALLTGGTMGEHISFYGEVEFARTDSGEIETGLERINTVIRPLKSTAFQIKIGAFEPGISMVSNHRRLTDHKYFFLVGKVGDNGWAPEPFQQGFEFFGVAAHRFLYNAGFVEGSGNASNNAKDAYGRVAYKFGGLRLDGTIAQSGGTSPSANPKPWSEKSVTVSVFGYRGNPLMSSTETVLINDPLTNVVTAVDTTTEQDDSFWMYGGDVSWNFGNLMVRAGAANRTDDSPFLGDPSIQDVLTQTRFGEVDYVLYPWLIPAIRYENFKVGQDETEQLSLTVNVLVRANIRGFVAANRIREPGGDYNYEEVLLGAKFGF